MIFPKLADIPRSQTPLLASDHGRSDRSAEECICGIDFNFRSALRELPNRDEGIRGVKANTNNINNGKNAHAKENTLSVKLGGAPKRDASEDQKNQKRNGQSERWQQLKRESGHSRDGGKSQEN